MVGRVNEMGKGNRGGSTRRHQEGCGRHPGARMGRIAQIGEGDGQGVAPDDTREGVREAALWPGPFLSPPC